jgi:ribosomal protein L37AE/L43A
VLGVFSFAEALRMDIPARRFTCSHCKRVEWSDDGHQIALCRVCGHEMIEGPPR